MAIVPTFTMGQIKARFNYVETNLQNAIIMRLTALGEACRNNAIEQRGYIDRTGNLQSSVGYIISKDGVVIRDMFVRALPTAVDGAEVGRTFAGTLIPPSGYALIVVAGMHYAAYVERLNRNVLTSAEQFAKAELPHILESLRKSIKIK